MPRIIEAHDSALERLLVEGDPIAEAVASRRQPYAILDFTSAQDRAYAPGEAWAWLTSRRNAGAEYLDD